MRFLSYILILFCIACSTAPSEQGSKILESDEKGVSNCKFLGSVDGESTFGAFTPEGLKEKAKSEALDKAAALGATHIIWESIAKTIDNTSVLAKAYRCQ
jgi:Domain of unknown function (DUF4156)